MVHKIEGLTEVHSKNSHCATVTTVQILVCLVLDSEQSICAITHLSLCKLGMAQIVLND